MKTRLSNQPSLCRAAANQYLMADKKKAAHPTNATLPTDLHFAKTEASCCAIALFHVGYSEFGKLKAAGHPTVTAVCGPGAKLRGGDLGSG